MGSIVGWRCEDCGSGEMFYCGGGMLSFNEPRVAEGSRVGVYGPAMKALLGDGIPSGWTVISERCFFACSRCDSIIEGETFTIDDGSGGWLVYYDEPSACEKCGNVLISLDEKIPLSEREITARCNKRVEEGCPECGGKKCSFEWGCWD